MLFISVLKKSCDGKFGEAILSNGSFSLSNSLPLFLFSMFSSAGNFPWNAFKLKTELAFVFSMISVAVNTSWNLSSAWEICLTLFTVVRGE